MKIENPRTDIVSHKRYPKEQLIRLIKSNGEIIIDEASNKAGRGVYVHKDEESIRKLIKVAPRALQCEISESLIDELLKLL